MTIAAPEPKENQGRPEPRIDARLKVTGEARYPADFALPNLAHAVLVTSSIARGTVTAVRKEAALAVPGVLDVLTYGDADALENPTFGNGNMTSVQPLKKRRIEHDGQIVALVVADTFEAASEGASKVRVEYRPEPASATLESEGTEVIPAVGNTQNHKEDASVGDFAGAFERAPVKLEAEYRTPAQHHNPIELFSTTAVWHDGDLTVYEPSQSVHGHKNALAKQLRVDPARVRVVSPFIGGAFGSKGPLSPRAAIVALAAQKLNRPVRCVVSRMQAFTTQTYRAETRHRIQMGATADGRVVAFSHEGWELTSRPDNYVVGGTDATTRIYDWGAVQSKVSLVKADRQTPGYMRSPPEVPYVFALEGALDELAEKLGMDPIELRRVNDTMVEPIKKSPFTSRSLMACFDQAAKAFDWSRRRPTPGATRNGDWLVGYGCATTYYPSNTAASTARVRFSPDGKVVVQTASHEIGTGVRTVAAQMAAERLGVDLAAVTVEMGDTSLPPAPVAGGSNSTASVCSTVLKACDAIRARVFKAVAEINDSPVAGRAASELDLRSGEVVARDGARAKLADLLRKAGVGVIEEYAEFIPEGGAPDAIAKLYAGQTSMSGGSHGKKMMFAFGAEFVEVHIHRLTREIRVPRLVGAFAAGRIMNTRTARSQLMGGLIWGMSSALHEATEIDPRNARIVNRDLQDYLVPVNADARGVEVLMLSEVDREVNPAGVKGLGELGNVGTNAAIANAVYNATGKRIRRLPIRVEDLLA